MLFVTVSECCASGLVGIQADIRHASKTFENGLGDIGGVDMQNDHDIDSVLFY